MDKQHFRNPLDRQQTLVAKSQIDALDFETMGPIERAAFADDRGCARAIAIVRAPHEALCLGLRKPEFQRRKR